MALKAKYTLVNPKVVQEKLDYYKGNDTDREGSLKKIFTEAGCPPSDLSEQAVPRGKQPNVICLLPGTTPETIVIGAHFDHVSEGGGLIDNWTGASLLPSLFQSVSGSPRKHTFIFVGFAAEEKGEIGSKFYVSQLSKETLSHIQLMINLDTLGLGPSEVWSSRSDKDAVTLLAGTAHLTHLPLTGRNVDGFGESDEESFIKQNVCTITVHSLTPQTTHVLHNAADSPSALHFQDYDDSYRLLAAYLVVLDAQLGDEVHPCPSKTK